VRLLHDLRQLEPGYALKVPASELPGGVVNVRSALSRATQLRGYTIHTSSDAEFLYIWKGES
jgi:hypothetical protein